MATAAHTSASVNPYCSSMYPPRDNPTKSATTMAQPGRSTNRVGERGGARPRVVRCGMRRHGPAGPGAAGSGRGEGLAGEVDRVAVGDHEVVLDADAAVGAERL